MICKNCGKEIAEDARWCNFCGAVNFDNPENNNLKEMINNKSTKKIKQLAREMQIQTITKPDKPLISSKRSNRERTTPAP